jgi:hypothetical protein
MVVGVVDRISSTIARIHADGQTQFSRVSELFSVRAINMFKW